MSKKDRIAVVLTFGYFFAVFIMFISMNDLVKALFYGLLPLFIYWGYRFIKNDISFLHMKDAN